MWVNFSWENITGNVQGLSAAHIQIPMQECKSLCIAVTICTTLVNTQTHTDMHAEIDSFRLVIYY